LLAFLTVATPTLFSVNFLAAGFLILVGPADFLAI
jgi:hypothetical protein